MLTEVTPKILREGPAPGSRNSSMSICWKTVGKKEPRAER